MSMLWVDDLNAIIKLMTPRLKFFVFLIPSYPFVTFLPE